MHLQDLKDYIIEFDIENIGSRGCGLVVWSCSNLCIRFAKIIVRLINKGIDFLCSFIRPTFAYAGDVRCSRNF